MSRVQGWGAPEGGCPALLLPCRHLPEGEGFASPSPLHPAGTFMLLLTNEECQRWISPHGVLSATQ